MLQLAELWVSLEKVRRQINDTCIPYGMHLGIEDQELMIYLENTAKAIDNHFFNFRLQASRKETDHA
jgi:hypothetical protein